MSMNCFNKVRGVICFALIICNLFYLNAEESTRKTPNKDAVLAGNSARKEAKGLSEKESSSEIVEPPDVNISKSKTGLAPLFRINQYVFDTSKVLTTIEKERIQQVVLQFRQETGFPMAVVVLNNLKESGSDSAKPKAVAKKYLDQLVEGRQDEGGRKGWLILIAVEDKAVWIQKGTGWSESVTEPILNIINQTMVPYLKLRSDGNNSELKRDYAGAVVAGVNEMLKVLYRHQIVAHPVISMSLDQFAAKSWLWILLGLHLLGLIYILCTKESEGWYLAGILFGFPILIAMLIFVLQGDEDLDSEEGLAQKGFWNLGEDPSNVSATKDHACTWGYW